MIYTTRRKVLTLLLIMTAALNLAACGEKSNIVGRWKGSHDKVSVIMTFYSNNTVTGTAAEADISQKDEILSGTYTFDENGYVMITLNGKTVKGKLEDGVIKLKDEESDFEVDFYKITDLIERSGL